MAANRPDPTDFTGEEVDEGRLSGLKSGLYSRTGIEDEGGGINKRRRNFLAATGAFLGLGAGAYGAERASDGEFSESVTGSIDSFLKGSENCETVYGVSFEVALEEGLTEEFSLIPNEDEQYIISQDSEDDWWLSGLTAEEGSNQYEWESVDISDARVEELLSKTGENETYEMGEDVVEYCDDAESWPK